MRNALAIARKELSIYFTTPWAYVVFTAMLGISSFFFVNLLATFREVQNLARAYGWNRLPGEYAAFKNLTDGVVVQLWDVIAVVTLFVAPFLSMRLFAEEKRNRTFELPDPRQAMSLFSGMDYGHLNSPPGPHTGAGPPPPPPGAPR